jgi:cation:H+ antiporter
MQLELAVPAFIVGLLILWKGSDMLIDATAKVAVRLGVSSLIISMTFVAYGTSMPEFAVSVGAALENNPSVSFGNILGSCVANLLLVLGLSAIIRPISVQPAVLRQEMPLMIGATLLLFLLPLVASVAPGLFWTVGILYLVCFAAYIWYVVKRARADAQQNGGPDLTKGKIHTHLPLIGLGIAAVVFGAWLLLEGAVAIARFFSISEMFIALSMVAVGTSLPELVVSLAAMA